MVNLLKPKGILVKAQFSLDVSPSARVDACAPLSVSEKRDNENSTSEQYIKPRDPAETRLMVEQWRATLPITDVDRRKGRRTSAQTLCNPPSWTDLDQRSPLSVDLIQDAASTTASSNCTEVGNNKGHWLVSIKRR